MRAALSFKTNSVPSVCFSANCRQIIQRVQMTRAGALVIKLTLHLPISQVECSLRPTVYAYSICFALVRERAAQLGMPTAKDSRHEVSNLPGHGRCIKLTDTWCRDS